MTVSTTVTVATPATTTEGLLRPAITLFIVLSVVTGLAYPLLTTGVAQAVFPDAANGSLRVLAHPTLVARSGEKASFHAGGEFPIPIASSQGTAGGGVTVTIEWKAFGVRVDFTPTVEEDSTITLVVDSEVSQLDFNNALTLSGFNVPSVIVRRTATTVSLRNGEYLVIGGLKQTDHAKSVERVPILGAIPVLGWFFSHSVTSADERELLVVVSPQVLAATRTLPQLPTDAPKGKR